MSLCGKHELVIMVEAPRAAELFNLTNLPQELFRIN